ncbi:MAG: PQQ-binding-like beta-propeller repeat protein [Treponema sp.]|jgi:outer membrane protein assembly factor BamB|nr:PQQ-binding-like beta-propeller repeat protein [Treponema sp.]
MAKNLLILAALFLSLCSGAARAQDIAPEWSRTLGGSITGIPAAQAESVVAVLDGGELRAFSSGGKALWTYAAGGRLSPYVSRSPEGVCYISRINGTFIAVNRAGRELWRVDLGASLSGPALIGWDGRIFVPAGNRILCYTGAGQLLWHKNLERPAGLSPELDKDGGIVLALENGALLRIDPFGNTRSLNLSALPRSILSIGSAGDGTCRFLVAYRNGGLETVDLGDPSGSGWRPPLPGLDGRLSLPPLPSPPLAAVSRGEEAAALLRDGRVVLLRSETGKVLWEGESHAGGQAPDRDPAAEEAAMIFDERGIYALTRSGASGFTMDGRRLWNIRLDNATSLPVFGDDGKLYSGAKDWTVYAYRLEERARARKQSLYGPAPEGLYGTGNPPPSPWAAYPYRFESAAIETRLERLESAVSAGSLGDMELAYTADLMELAGAASVPAASPAHPPVYTNYRIRALRFLGLFGNRETIPFLVRVFNGDADPLVKAAAAEALGRIGTDPEGIALSAFANSLFAPGQIRDEQALTAVAAAVGSLCRFSGPPLSETGIRLLTVLGAPEQPQLVRARARQELRSLSR